MTRDVEKMTMEQLHLEATVLEEAMRPMGARLSLVREELRAKGELSQPRLESGND